MTLKERIESFSELGHILRDSLDGKNTRYSSDLEKLINNQQFKNGWFTPEYVRMAIKAIAGELTYDNLAAWTSRYPAIDSPESSLNIGVVMAGNIPLAGFHDFLSVLITGNTIIAKTSSKDPDLIVFISNILCEINREFSKRISFTDGLLRGFDAVIATGSDNSSRYFEYYFGKYPHIIRKNRNSLAILDGRETSGELSGLGSDVFSYFGLGCRSISKVFLPEGYDAEKLKSSWAEYERIIHHNKYANNFDYNKAIFIVNRNEFTDFGFLLLRKSPGISSPVAVLHFEYYNTINNVYLEIEKMRDKIQCVVSRKDIPYGRAQWPHLWDYADGTDTVGFLLKKN
jgi:Acyl-CoA reductase (LuxC)